METNNKLEDAKKPKHILDKSILTWVTLPATLFTAEVAVLLNCRLEEVSALTAGGLISFLGEPAPNGPKHYHTETIREKMRSPEFCRDYREFLRLRNQEHNDENGAKRRAKKNSNVIAGPWKEDSAV